MRSSRRKASRKPIRPEQVTGSGRHSGGVTLLTAACSRNARSQKRQPTWFPHWPTAKRRDKARAGPGAAGKLRASQPLTLDHHRLRHDGFGGPPRPLLPTVFQLGARKPPSRHGGGGGRALTAVRFKHRPALLCGDSAFVSRSAVGRDGSYLSI